MEEDKGVEHMVGRVYCDMSSDEFKRKKGHFKVYKAQCTKFNISMNDWAIPALEIGSELYVNTLVIS